eukprot:scaffold254914_cov41-Tisochrysis_lutea.AAC.3
MLESSLAKYIVRPLASRARRLTKTQGWCWWLGRASAATRITASSQRSEHPTRMQLAERAPCGRKRRWGSCARHTQLCLRLSLGGSGAQTQTRAARERLIVIVIDRSRCALPRLARLSIGRPTLTLLTLACKHGAWRGRMEEL